MWERRRYSRERAFQAGTVAAVRRPGSAYCVVRDLSEGGALLLLDEAQRAPSDIELTLTRGGAVHRARVVWRGDNAVGVAFVSESGPEAVSAVVISIDAARRERGPGSDERRLAERIARVLNPRRSPGDFAGR